MVSYLTFRDKLDVLSSDFTSGKEMSGINGSYRSDLGMISSAWNIKSNCVMQFIRGGGVVPGKQEDQNSYQEELGGQLGVICAIEIMEFILISTTLVVNRCNNIRTLRQASIHPEAVKSRCKQAYLISRLSDAFQSIDLDMLLVHRYGKHNIVKPESTLNPPA